MIKFYNNIDFDIDFEDIYMTPNYGRICELSDNAEWECCIYKDLIYVYLKREFLYNNKIYYDLITPYGYSGFQYKKIETFNEFIILFRKEALKRNYLTEVIRQNPYINSNIYNYEVITSRNTYGVNLKNYKQIEEYLNLTSKNNKRSIIKSIKNNLIFKFENYDYINNELLVNNFIKIYNQTMTNLNANKYYFFSNEYYKKLDLIKSNIKIANVYKEDLLIASCIIFIYNDYMNYHIGGSLLEYRDLCPNNFLHYNVIKYGIENNKYIYHLGGGLCENDTLSKFKDSIADTKFNYTIYKNIINKDIYNMITQNLDKTLNYFPLHRK